MVGSRHLPAPCSGGGRQSGQPAATEPDVLEKRGHSVALASNGREAVEAVDREKFDIALFDVQMPEMSGIEATTAIRAREREEAGQSGVRRSGCRICAITANAMKGDREVCLAAGMDNYIAKPIHQQEVFEVVEHACIIQASDLEVSFDGALFDGDPEFLAEIVNLFLETLSGSAFPRRLRTRSCGEGRRRASPRGSYIQGSGGESLFGARGRSRAGAAQRSRRWSPEERPRPHGAASQNVLVLRAAVAPGGASKFLPELHGERFLAGEGEASFDVKILIAEDDAISAAASSIRSSRKWGYEVVIANDGSEAWRELQQENAPRLGHSRLDDAGDGRRRSLRQGAGALRRSVRVHSAAFGQEPERGSGEGPGIRRRRLHYQAVRRQ